MTAVPAGPHCVHSVEAEQAALSILLQFEAKDIAACIRAGGASLFYDPVHARIYEAIAAKSNAGDMVSFITLAVAMEADEGLQQLGGRGYLVRLAGLPHNRSNMRDMVQLLSDLSGKRRMAELMADAQASIVRQDGSVSDIKARLEAGLMQIAMADNAAARPVSMNMAVAEAMAQSSAAYRGENDTAVKSGIDALDRIVSGFYPGELILIGGRPSMGKTGVALSLALNAARAGQGVCIASLEMNPEAMALRALSEQTARQKTAVAYANIRRGDMADYHVESLTRAAEEVRGLPIMFLPRQYADIGALIAGARQVQAAMNGNMRLLVIDYAQLLKADGRSRYDQITQISMALKGLAGQLNVPVIALSQLSRAVEQRDDKRPIMADLRESGQLEQDADAVLFCYRDEYYLEREKPAPDDPVEDHDDWQAAMEKARNRLEIIVAKQRQGEIGTAHVRFNPALNLIWQD